MPQRNITGLVVALVAAAALVACSRQLPAAPSVAGRVPSSATFLDTGTLNPQAVAGSYTLNLANTKGEIVETLTLGTLYSELLLWAQVRDSSGVLATGGAVIFQACRRGGTDYTVWRPSAECASGQANWVHLATVSVEEGCPPFAPEVGNACRIFGTMPAPTTIGFRYRYIGQGSGIANGESASQDMTW
jgi:hypothetical protein